VRGMLHAADGARGAAVLVSGAGGGVVGPFGVYAELSERLRADGVTALRLDYRSRTISRSASTTSSRPSTLSVARASSGRFWWAGPSEGR
jgi:hypothetical protein